MAENSVAERRRGPGRPFSKGVSGNPGGRPRRVINLETELVQAQDTPRILEVVEKLREMALAGDVQAARLYLDRVVGPVRANDEERIEVRAEELVEQMLAEARACARERLTND